jgi:exopolysaccharide biosynthesis polyprenyl glycosylphosphotransferase
MNVFKLLYQVNVVKFLRKGNHANYVFGGFDLLMLMLTYQISYRLFNPDGALFFFLDREYFLLFSLILPSWILILHICNVARIPRTSRYSRLFFEFMQFTVLSLAILFLIQLILKFDTVTPNFIYVLSSLSMVLLYCLRVIEFKLFKLYRANGFNYINIVIIADGSSELFIEKILEQKDWGYRILMIMTDSKLLKAKFSDRIKVMPEKSLFSLKNLLEFDIVDEVIYYKRKMHQPNVKQLIKSCEEIGVVFRINSDISPVLISTGYASQIWTTSFLSFVNIPDDSFGMAWKNLMDVFLSFFFILVLSPFMLMVALMVKFSSPGPVIFKQARVGLRGRQFYLYKFRTMVVNAEALRKQLEAQNEMDGPAFKIKNDPRITPVGRFLRKTGLDELPQLFNVLNGEMSLIGPRPPLKSETQQYKRWQLRRLSVKPGITCSWQIIPGRNDIEFENWMKLDLAYIDNWSPKLDFMLLIKTIRTVLFGTGS